MHVKRTATIVIGGGALAAWLAGAATSNRALSDPIVPRPSPIDARGADLDNEIARLRERLRPSSTPRTPARNVFRYQAMTAAPAAAAPPPPRAAIVDAPAAAPALPPLRLSGIAEDPGPDGTPVRVAFISGDGQLHMVKEGELATPRYRVVKIGADAVELADLTDNTIRRLALR